MPVKPRVPPQNAHTRGFDCFDCVFTSTSLWLLDAPVEASSDARPARYRGALVSTAQWTHKGMPEPRASTRHERSIVELGVEFRPLSH